MLDLGERLAESRDLIEPSWTAAREVRLRAAVIVGLKRERRQRAALVAVLGAAILVFGIWLGRRQGSVAHVAAPEPAALVRLEDGSVVTARSSEARVESVAVAPDAVTLRLEQGSAHFSVTPNPERPFRVLAGDVTVSVLGTVFDVALEPSGVRVAVERGRVRVGGPRGTRELGVGESELFAAVPVTTPSALELAPPAPTADETPEPTRGPSPQASWRSLAVDGAYGPALARLTAEGPNAVRDTPEDLLLAADVARLGGHPERAVAPLERVINGHPFDSRAPLAAFTLGRTLLEQLGRPRQAAHAFATARQLDRAGALTQDALAREVEAWSRAGDSEKARERATEYLKRYPTGRRAGAVRRLGGVD